MKQLTDIQKEWVAALRSGEYRQGRDKLRNGDEFCCLGVLCDLAAKRGIGKWEGNNFLECHAFMPDLVQEEAGLRTAYGTYGPNPQNTLVADNDNGATFAEIADLIEAKAEELFV